MEDLELVIFDVDGLLLNTEFLWQKAWNEVGKKHNLPKIAETFHKVVGISGNDVKKVLDDNLGNVNERDKLLKEIRMIATQYLEDKTQLMPGVLETLDKLEQLHVRKAVATTTKRDVTLQRLTKLGIIDRFEYILCGDEVTKRKPNPEIYNTILKQVNCSAKNALVLEDTGYGVQAAHDAGIKVIMVPSINLPTDKDKSNAYKVVSNLFDVIAMLEEIKR